MSRTKQNNLRNSGESQLHASPRSWRGRIIFPTSHVVFAPWCKVCVKAKGTGAQHRRQTVEELAKQEQDGPRICSDFFHVSEAGVATPMLALKFSR